MYVARDTWEEWMKYNCVRSPVFRILVGDKAMVGN